MSSIEANGLDRSAGDQLDDLFEEIAAKVQAGEPVDLEKYAATSPESAERIRRLLPAIESLARLGRGPAVQAADHAAAAVPSSGILGEFRIQRQIGRGGMGVVYEAVQTSLGRRVALKILPFAAVLDPRRLQRFKNEAMAAAALDHPNVVHVYSIGCELGVHYYAMQFIEGQTLAQIIDDLRNTSAARGRARDALAKTLDRATALSASSQPGGPVASGPQPPPQGPSGPAPQDADDATGKPRSTTSSDAARSREFFRAIACLGVQAARALEHAHQTGVVHRDIKPSNLMVDAHGHLWVTDFGLALVETGLDLTLSGQAVGTLPYMSPEQMQGNHGLVDHRTDVYSLGITLYEALTLQPAFAGKRREALLRQVLEGEPRPPRRVNPAVPRDLETIVEKAISKEAAGRYATAQELADDLQRFLDDKPIRAHRPSLAQRIVKWVRRHRGVVWLAVGLLMLAALGLAVSTAIVWNAQQKTANALQAADEARKGAEKALAEAEKARKKAGRALLEAHRSEGDAKAVEDFLLKDLLTAIDPQRARGRAVTVDEVLTAAEKKIDRAFVGQPLVEARLRWTIANVRSGLGQYEAAERQLRLARKLFMEQVSAEHRQTLLVGNSLAAALSAEGKFAEAEKLVREVLAAQRRAIGANDPNTAESMLVLGVVLAQQNRFDDVRKSLEEAPAIFQHVYGEPGRGTAKTDQDTLESMSHLAHVLKRLGKLDEGALSTKRRCRWSVGSSASNIL